MPEVAFVRDQKLPVIRFAVSPVYNALASLCLLAQEVDNMSPWADRSRNGLNEDERRMAKLACEAIAFVRGSAAQDIESWLTEFTATPGGEIVHTAFSRVAEKAARVLSSDDRSSLPGLVGVPTVASLSESEDLFVETVYRVAEVDGIACEETREAARKEFARLRDPRAYRDEIAGAVRTLWDRYLRSEWPTALARSEASARALSAIPILGDGVEERLRSATGRDYLADFWIAAASRVREVVYIPSSHIGPYMILLDVSDECAWFVGNARTPEARRSGDTPTDRSELLTRLGALSDPSRLRILEIAAGNGAITTQDVIDELGLSQSSASRHLTQLAATGMLSVDAKERTKRYRVNAARVDAVLNGARSLILGEVADKMGGAE